MDSLTSIETFKDVSSGMVVGFILCKGTTILPTWTTEFSMVTFQFELTDEIANGSIYLSPAWLDSNTPDILPLTTNRA